MLEKNAIKKLFAILQARYGHKWTTAYDDADIMRIAINEWHRCLQGFTERDIANGLDAWTDPWPPSLPEFVEACMPDLAALGFDVEREVQRRLPAYRYVTRTATDESMRNKEAQKIRAEVTQEFQQQAQREIREQGVTKLLEGGEHARIAR